MNGADSLVKTLLGSGVNTCFANPGTSEMHFVAALDHEPEMRCILALFEGVASGAADGYARITDKPAATLLHCGPGLANSLANLHNAQRARVPLVNLVGDQATHQRPLDPPLTADTEGWARPVSGWVRTARTAASVGSDTAEAVQAARTAPGQIATLIMPSDTCWDEGGVVGTPLPVPSPALVTKATVENIARILRSGESALMILGGSALRQEGLEAAHRLAQSTGLRLLAGQNNTRVERGQGRPPISCVPYPVNTALAATAGVKHVILAGNTEPVAFFAYPGKPGRLYPSDATLHVLARPEQNITQALQDLVAELDCPPFKPTPVAKPELPGIIEPMNRQNIARALAAMLPEQAIIIDESITWRLELYEGTHFTEPHDWLQLTGGAIGIGLPLALGAAIGAPGRKVVSLQADGSAMYTVQALWSQARERANITTIILSNRKYAILLGELANVGAKAGKTASEMFNLDNPEINWVKLANSFGVEAERVDNLGRFIEVFSASNKQHGPFLIELVI